MSNAMARKGVIAGLVSVENPKEMQEMAAVGKVNAT